MSEYKDFTSLPPDKEQQFIIYEKTSVETGIKAKRLGMIVSGIFGVIVVVIALSFDKPKNIMADDPSTNLKKAGEATEKKEAPKAEAPKPDTPATDATDAEKSDAEDAPTDGEAAEGDSDAESASDDEKTDEEAGDEADKDE